MNPKFLDSGVGTIDNPYLMDMNILQLYFKTSLYKSNIVNFKKVTVNIHIDISKEAYMSHFLLDWVHDLTNVNFIPWNVGFKSIKPSQLIKIVLNSSKMYSISI